MREEYRPDSPEWRPEGNAPEPPPTPEGREENFGGLPDPSDGAAAGVGIPEKMRIRRRQYTMSDAAMAARQKGGASPRPGLLGNRNNWRHGQYAKSMLTRIKPCLSTCARYPCELVEEGATEAGSDCLDVQELLAIVRAVHKVLDDPEDNKDFNQVASVNIGNSIRILEMLQEDILRDGSIVRSFKMNKDGDVIGEEVKLHPSLYALPKLISELNMSPDAFMVTPKAQAKAKSEEDAVKSIADVMAAAGSQLMAARKKPDPPDEGP